MDTEPEAYGEADAVRRARWRYRRGYLTDAAGRDVAWAAVPPAEREQMMRRLAEGHWGGLRRVEGHPDEWVLYYGRWKIRGLWDRPRERLVVLAVIAVC